MHMGDDDLNLPRTSPDIFQEGAFWQPLYILKKANAHQVWPTEALSRISGAFDRLCSPSTLVFLRWKLLLKQISTNKHLLCYYF